MNNLEVAQMINNLSNMVTSETLLDQLDFVADPKEEAELVRKEQAEKQEQTVNSLYSRPIKTNEQEE